MNNNKKFSNDYRENISINIPKNLFTKIYNGIKNFLFLEKYYIYKFSKWIHFFAQTIGFIIFYSIFIQYYGSEIPFIIMYIIYYIAVRTVFEIFLLGFSINDKLTRICDIVEGNNNEKVVHKSNNPYEKSVSFKV